MDAMSDSTTPGSSADSQDAAALAHRLFDAAREGETALLAAYLDAGAPADMQDAAGNTMVMLAAYHGHADTVAALLERGADADIANDRGQTALAGAVFKGFADVVETLVNAGADPKLGSPNAIDSARFFQRTELLELLERS